MVGLTKEGLVGETSLLLRSEAAYQSMIADHNPYGDGHASERIVQAILHHFGRVPRPEDFIPSSGGSQYKGLTQPTQ